VSQLCQTLTMEELLGWAAFFELRNEQEEKAANQAKTRARAGAMGTK